MILRDYQWAKYSAQHLYGESDRTFVPLGDYDFDRNLSRDQPHILREGILAALYGAEWMHADQN